MKFERINDNKMKVTLNMDDLTEGDIDLHSFMSETDSSHSLFLDVLQKAEQDYGFTTKNYNLKVETVAMSNGNFIITITRVLDKSEKKDEMSSENDLNIKPRNIKKIKPHVERKVPDISFSSVVYCFSTFDNFCDFALMIKNNKSINVDKIAKDTVLYNYKNKYYLIFNDINSKFKQFKQLFSLMSEFSTFVDASSVFIAKINECGKIVFKHKALHNCIKYFSI